MEVLISIFVLSVGLLGVAALIPVGKFTLMETDKADRAGACGRAALREIRVRRLLEPQSWSEPTVVNQGTAFAIDPLGIARGMPQYLGDGPLRRITFRQDAYWVSPESFYWNDDLVFDQPDDLALRPRGLFQAGDDMTQIPSATSPPVTDRHYSWFITVAPARAELAMGEVEQRHQFVSTFEVSAVVCRRRRFDAQTEDPAEQTVGVAQMLGGGLGGGGVRLATPVGIRADEWLMLATPGGEVARWYRVVSVGDAFGAGEQYLSLAGPDWPYAAGETRAVVVQGVVGVYSTTVTLDRIPAWVR